MLLRRIIEHVKAQNWTAVGLDFVIVVAGVFMGIQVSNWNGERQRLAIGDAFLQRLTEDVRAEIGVIENRVESYEDVHAHAEKVVAALSAPRDSLGSDFLHDAYNSTVVWRFRRTQDAYDELVAIGELGLIADARVRAELSRYYRDMEVVAGIWDAPSAFRVYVRRHLPASIQVEIRERCWEWNEGEFEKIHFAIRQDCQLNLSNEERRIALGALLGADATSLQEFGILANELIGVINFKIESLERKRDNAVDLLALLEDAQ